jgi:poly(3-hydroxyalkanoate) synthetase
MNTSLQCPPALGPASITSGLLDSWIKGWSVGVKGLGECLAAALRGSPGLIDVPRWLDLMATRRPPSWTSPNEVVFEAPIARLRDFSPAGASRRVVPTLVLPPQAGHDSCIVDYSSEQSQIGTVIASGLERAFSLDWVGATSETADSTIEDYLDLIDRAVEHCGSRVNLIGDCQGGWLATIYAALNPERVNTLTLAGAPIDFHAGEPVIHEVVRRLAPAGDLRFYKALVAADGGVLKGERMLAGFIFIQPGDEISRQLELLRHVHDQAHVERYQEFEDWFKHTQDIPGAFYLWIVEHLFRDNALVAGALEIGGRNVSLTEIDMPLFLLAGATDHITPPDQVFAIAALVSTPQELIHRDVTSGGHLGLFMGHEALHNHWPPLLAKVLGHSRIRAAKAA